MTAWDELLAATHPGREVDDGLDRWLILRRSYRQDPENLSARPDIMTITVELVRSGSHADPRRLPADAPTPRRTPREDH